MPIECVQIHSSSFIKCYADITLLLNAEYRLHLFAGKDKVNIGLAHRVRANEPHRAMWEIVDLVHSCDELKIKFPSYDEQKIIAEGFKRKSAVNFGNCIKYADSMLV